MPNKPEEHPGECARSHTSCANCQTFINLVTWFMSYNRVILLGMSIKGPFTFLVVVNTYGLSILFKELEWLSPYL